MSKPKPCEYVDRDGSRCRLEHGHEAVGQCHDCAPAKREQTPGERCVEKMRAAGHQSPRSGRRPLFLSRRETAAIIDTEIERRERDLARFDWCALGGTWYKRDDPNVLHVILVLQQAMLERCPWLKDETQDSLFGAIKGVDQIVNWVARRDAERDADRHAMRLFLRWLRANYSKIRDEHVSDADVLAAIEAEARERILWLKERTR